MDNTQNCQQQEQERPYSVPSEEYYVFMRYKSSRIQRFKNSVTKQKSIIENYGGEAIGTVESCELIEDHPDAKHYGWPTDRCMALLKFPSRKNLQLWFDGCPEIRQQDWLEDDVDIIAIPLKHVPVCNLQSNDGFRRENNREKDAVFQLLDMTVHDKETFWKHYVPGAMPQLEASGSGCDAAVVATDKIIKLRGTWDPEMVVVHLWESKERFWGFYNSDTYCNWRDVRAGIADTKMLLFQLVPRIW